MSRSDSLILHPFDERHRPSSSGEKLRVKTRRCLGYVSSRGKTCYAAVHVNEHAWVGYCHHHDPMRRLISGVRKSDRAELMPYVEAEERENAELRGDMLEYILGQVARGHYSEQHKCDVIQRWCPEPWYRHERFWEWWLATFPKMLDLAAQIESYRKTK